MTSNKQKPVETLCLCRVSSDKQAKKETITSQKQACLNYAQYNGFVIDQFFFEDGVSGWKTNRPGLEAIVAYIEKEHKRKHIRILFYDISRLARNLSVYAAFEEIVVKYDIELQTVMGGKTDNSANGRFMRGLEALQARRFSDELSEKTKGCMRALCSLGYYPLNPPLGLKRIKDEHKRTILVADEPRAKFIRQAFEKYLRGELETKHAVCVFLRNSGAFNGIKLNDTKIDTILKNEVYTGTFAYDKWGIERQKWKIEHIIPTGLFLAVQQKLNRTGRQTHTSDISAEFPLRNLVCCASCGQPLTGYLGKGRGGKPHPYYCCFNTACDIYKKSIRRAILHGAFEQWLDAIRMPDTVLPLFDRVLRHVCVQKDMSIKQQRINTARELAKLDEKISNITCLVADATANNDDTMRGIYSDQLRKLAEQKTALESQLDDMKLLSDTETFLTAMKKGCDFFKHPAILWKNGNLNQRRRLVQMIFQDRPQFNRENGLLTAATPWIFNKKSAQTDGKSDLAAPTGFEPVFSP